MKNKIRVSLSSGLLKGVNIIADYREILFRDEKQTADRNEFGDQIRSAGDTSETEVSGYFDSTMEVRGNYDQHK